MDQKVERLEREVRRWKFECAYRDVWDLERRCFELDLALCRLERKWSRATPSEHRRLSLTRMELRHDLEMIKIDLDSMRRRFVPLLQNTVA